MRGVVSATRGGQFRGRGRQGMPRQCESCLSALVLRNVHNAAENKAAPGRVLSPRVHELGKVLVIPTWFLYFH